MTRAFEPHPYQHEAIEHLYSTPRAALWMPMGGGKTVSTLTALNNLSLVEDVFPVLVLAPLRVAKTTWPEEVAKWEHLAHLRVSVITGSAKERQSAIRSPADIYACNYDNLVWLVEELGEDWPFKTVIADEFTRLKSFRIRQGSKRAGALGKVAHTKVQRFIGLTGTPSPNGLQDLWGQTWFLDQGKRLGRTYSAFSDRWFSKGYDGYSLKPLPTAQADIEGRLKDICLTVNALPVDEPVHNQIRVDLPPAARKLYRDMEKEMFAQIEEHGVEALNAAAKTLKCLAAGTEVLTASGWKPIEDYRPGDKLWDGVEWVSADNLVCNGYMPVVSCWGVRMTADHRILTRRGWREAHEVINAQSSGRYDRQDVRLPDSAQARGIAAGKKQFDGTSNVVGALCLRPGNNCAGRQFAEPQQRPAKILRLPSRRDAHIGVGRPRHDEAPRMDNVAEYEIALRKSKRQRLAKLRSAWDSCLSAMGGIFQSVLGRYGRDVSRWSYAGAFGRERKLYAGKLLLGDEASARKQHAAERKDKHPERRDDSGASRASFWSKIRNNIRAHSARMGGKQIVDSADVALVYDIVNAGPRHRFTVRGSDGVPFLAHNCLQLANGACYTDDQGNWADVHDAKLEALESVIEEAAGAPVLVAYHFKSDLQRLRKAFPKAQVLDKDPATIARWNRGEIPILLAHPASAGHGLNLADGGNILVFFSLNWNLEEHMQIIERIGPLRQKQAGHNRPVFVHYIMARQTVDSMVLERLQSKKTVQEVLVEAMKRKASF